MNVPNTTFNFTGTLQSYTVPVAGQYLIISAGAQGGSSTASNGSYSGGLGAVVQGLMTFGPGQVFDIVVGGKGNDGVGAGGGGGGSFIFTAGSLLEAAGGGGGASASSASNGGNAPIYSDAIVEVPTGFYNNTVEQEVITGINGSNGSGEGGGAGGVMGQGGGGGTGQWGGGGGGAGWGNDGSNGGSWGLPDYRPLSLVYEPPTYSHLYGGQGGSGKTSFFGGAGSINSQAGSGGFGGGGGAGVHYDSAFGYTFYAGGGGGGASGGGGGGGGAHAGAGGGGGSFLTGGLQAYIHPSIETNAGNGSVVFILEREFLSDRHRAYDVDAYENAGAVVRLFNAALARPHDHEGAGFWVKALDTGTALTVVADAILNSEEYNFINGGNQTNDEFVEMLYGNALHRNPDQAGEVFWLSKLDSGSATRADVLISIGESAESILASAELVANGVLFQEWL